MCLFRKMDANRWDISRDEGRAGAVTDKELQKLKRRDLLQLLLDQAQETEQLRRDLAAAADKALEMEATFERLKERLNEQDARIQELNDTLQKEREGQMTGLAEVGSIAEAALQLNNIFEVAQRAADLYLRKVHELPQPEVMAAEVVPEVVIEPAWQESARPAPPPPGHTVVDVEPKVETPPPSRTVVDVEPKVETPPVQPERAAAPAAEAQPQRRGLFQRKKRGEKEKKGKFVLSFGWEQD